MLSAKAMFYGICMLYIVALFAPVNAMAGQKDFIGIEWGPVSGSGVTTLFGGKEFNKLFKGRWFTAIDSSTSRRGEDTVIIESLYGAGVVLRLPVTHSLYVKGNVNYAVMGRVNDSSYSGMSYNVGVDYDLLYGWGLTLTFGKIGDINTFNGGVTITF
jgi:hypothetical protein